MTKARKFISFLLAALMLTGAFAFTTQAKAVKPRKITAVTAETLKVIRGLDFQLKVKMSPKNANSSYLKWSIVKGSENVKFKYKKRSGVSVSLTAIKPGTALVRCKIKGTSKKVDFKITVNTPEKTIAAASARNITVSPGVEFELEVKPGKNVKDNELEWTIVSGKGVIKFEDGELYGNSRTFTAVSIGEARVRCRIKGTDKKVVFKITVK